MRHPVISILLIVLCTLTNTCYAANKVQNKQTLSRTFHIDKIYKSMKGPQNHQNLYLLDNKTPELLWITGYEAVMVGEDGKQPMAQEFMCHSNLDWQANNHRKHFADTSQWVSSRLFTLSQGQFKVNLPKGFGIPVISNQPLSLTMQVLNLNHENNRFKVRHKVKVNFVRDKNLRKPYTALYPSSAYGLKVLEGEDGAHFNIANDNASDEQHGSGCLVGETAGRAMTDRFGRRFTGHWVVKPGQKEVNHTYVTGLMNLPYDTKIHYIATHLHPFAESLELIDRTTGKTVFKSKARNYKKKIGLKHVDYFSSKKGIPVFKDHEYELISIYNNTSLVDQDSMAVMYLYLADKSFDVKKMALND